MRVVTPSGVAELCWYPRRPAIPKGLLLLGHGAGGGFGAPDLLLVSDLAYGLGMAVGHVEQPYRVEGKRAPAPAARLDAAFIAVVAAARKTRGLAALPLVVGGRSSGGRVACRTARAVGADGVLALAFPLEPPRRGPGPAREAPSRLPELLAAGAPALVVQGDRDAFGSADQLSELLASSPAITASISVSVARGADHSLRKGIDSQAVASWLSDFLR